MRHIASWVHNCHANKQYPAIVIFPSEWRDNMHVVPKLYLKVVSRNTPSMLLRCSFALSLSPLLVKQIPEICKRTTLLLYISNVFAGLTPSSIHYKLLQLWDQATRYALPSFSQKFSIVYMGAWSWEFELLMEIRLLMQMWMHYQLAQ